MELENRYRAEFPEGFLWGGAVGGVITALLGARAYTMGYSTVMALPIFQDTFVAMLIGIIVAILVSAAVTFVLGFDESLVAKEA